MTKKTKSSRLLNSQVLKFERKGSVANGVRCTLAGVVLVVLVVVLVVLGVVLIVIEVVASHYYYD